MRSLFVVLFGLVVFISGIVAPDAKGIEIYTFRKKRLDQSLDGNRGYISGEAPAPGPRDDKRTLIGIDVELPGLADTEYYEEETPAVKESKVEPTAKPEVKQEPVEEFTVVAEEDWIK